MYVYVYVYKSWGWFFPELVLSSLIIDSVEYIYVYFYKTGYRIFFEFVLSSSIPESVTWRTQLTSLSWSLLCTFETIQNPSGVSGPVALSKRCCTPHPHFMDVNTDPKQKYT